MSTIYGMYGTCWHTRQCGCITCMKKVLSEEEESIPQHKPTQGSRSIPHRSSL